MEGMLVRPLTQEQYLKLFREVLEQMYQTTAAKNHDYAREEEALANFKEFGVVGVLVRISDKFQRLKNALWYKRSFIVSESIIDTMLDLAVYAVIMLVMYKYEHEMVTSMTISTKVNEANELNKRLRRSK